MLWQAVVVQEDNLLLRELIKFLLPRVVDKVEKVRKQALRGLGNLVAVWNEDVSATQPGATSPHALPDCKRGDFCVERADQRLRRSGSRSCWRSRLESDPSRSSID